MLVLDFEDWSCLSAQLATPCASRKSQRMDVPSVLDESATSDPGCTWTAVTIKSYPRDIKATVRKVDDRRKTERERKEERKDAERKQKEEEIKRMKNLKRDEIMNKLRQIQEATGTNIEELEQLDLEGDFDPETHDKQLQKVFDDQFYGQEAEEDMKPTWDDDIGAEYLEEEEGGEDFYPNAEDADFNMDADYVPLPKESKKDKRKKKKKSKEVSGAAGAAGAADEDEGGEGAEPTGEGSAEDRALMDNFAKAHGRKTLEQYLEELYNLDYEDVVGGVATRFKYREVEANDFGLSTQEILHADDKELNKWVSVKRMSQLRTHEDEERDKRRYGKKTFDLVRKRDAFPSLYKFYRQHEKDEKRKRKERKDKKRKRKEAQKAEGGGATGSSSSESGASSDSEQSSPESDAEEQPKKTKRARTSTSSDAAEGRTIAKSSTTMKGKDKSSTTNEKENASVKGEASGADSQETRSKKKDKKKKGRGKNEGDEADAPKVDNIPGSRLALYQALHKKKKRKDEAREAKEAEEAQSD